MVVELDTVTAFPADPAAVHEATSVRLPRQNKQWFALFFYSLGAVALTYPGVDSASLCFA